MKEANNNQYFSVEDGKLCYFGIPLQETGLIEESRSILDKLTLPGRLLREGGFSEDALRMCWISLAFCIAGQGQSFERPVRFARELCRYGLEYVADVRNVRDKAFGCNRWLEDRYSFAFDAIDKAGGIERVVRDYLDNPLETRRELIKIKWIHCKTSSFWHLCLGGKELMTLDVHNYRQLAGLGVKIGNPYLYIPRIRPKSGNRATDTASLKEYEQIERDALEFLSRFPEFLDNGKVKGDLATTIFWVAGAEASRKGAFYRWDKRRNSAQTQLFLEPPKNGSLKFDAPFVLENRLKRD